MERAPERLTGPYSLLLADPPYDDEAAPVVLERIARARLVGSDATLLFEHSRRREPPKELGTLRLAWSRRYGDTQVSIYRE